MLVRHQRCSASFTRVLAVVAGMLLLVDGSGALPKKGGNAHEGDSHSLVAATPSSALVLLDERTIEGTGTCNGLAFTPDGKMLVTSSGLLGLWDLTGKEPKKLRAAQPQFVRSLTLSPDAKTLVTARWNPTSAILTLRDMQLQERATFKGHDTGIVCAAFHPNGKLMATGGDDGGAFIWDITADKPKELTVLKIGGRGPNNGVGALGYTPDGKMLLVASRGGTVLSFFDVTAKEPKEIGQMKARDNLAFAISPDGKTIARGTNDRTKTIRLYTLEPKPTLKKVLEGHTENPSVLVFSPDSKTLVSCARDGKLIVWDTESGKPRFAKQRPQEFSSVALHLDDPRSEVYSVAASTAGKVFLYRIGREGASK